MSDRKISQLAQLTSATAAPQDLAVLVDVSDTTMAASGTTKQITVSQLLQFLANTPGQLVGQTDIGTAPNEIPLNGMLGRLAFQNPESLVLQPAASVTPHQLGSVVFELTNDTTLTIRARGSDGTVRSVALTLA
jgi:hypothetical protein